MQKTWRYHSCHVDISSPYYHFITVKDLDGKKKQKKNQESSLAFLSKVSTTVHGKANITSFEILMTSNRTHKSFLCLFVFRELYFCNRMEKNKELFLSQQMEMKEAKNKKKTKGKERKEVGKISKRQKFSFLLLLAIPTLTNLYYSRLETLSIGIIFQTQLF